jgi:hypothetical protein
MNISNLFEKCDLRITIVVEQRSERIFVKSGTNNYDRSLSLDYVDRRILKFVSNYTIAIVEVKKSTLISTLKSRAVFIALRF